MIERIVDWSAHNKVIVGFIFLAVAAAGVWAVMTTPLDAIPDLSENQVIVFTEYMGRSPQIVEDQITFPLVSALQGLPKVKDVRAQSMFGMSFIYVIFDEDAELYWARTRVLEKLATVQSTLPAGAKTSLGPDGTGVGQVFWYTVESTDKAHDLTSMRTLQDWFVKPQLQSVEGVAEVASIGGYVRLYQVNVDPEKLRAYGVTLDDVRASIQRSNNEVGGKIVEMNQREHFVRGLGYLTSAHDIESLTLDVRSGVRPIYVRDVAQVTIDAELRRGALEKNGTGEVAGGIVVMRAGENAKAVIDRVKAKIAQIAPGLPKNVEILTSYDRSELIEASVHNLRNTLLEEAAIVTLVILIFLFHLPSALRIIIEIPISVLIAFLMMRIFGMTSNIMSLGGIAIGIGVLVDASIVMLENAHRHLAEAQEQHEATGAPYDFSKVIIRSVKQVARPIFFSLLIIVVSFLPVFMLTGQEGKLFHPLAFTKTLSLLGSAIVSITLVPVLMLVLMKGKFRAEEKNPLSRFFRAMYQPVITWALRFPKTAIGLNLLALAVAVPIALSMGSEFMPALDEGSMLFMPTMLPNISLAEATRIMQEQDAIIKQEPEVSLVLGKVGKAESAIDPAPISMIETIVTLKPKDQWRPGFTKRMIQEELNKKLQIPGVAIGWTQPIINRINMLSTGVRTDLGVKFFGANLDTLESLAIRAERILKDVPGARDVVAERTQGGSYLDIHVDPEKAARYGITPGMVNDIVASAIGGENVATMIEGRARFPISVRYMQDFRNSVASIEQLPVPLPTQSVGVADFATGNSIASIGSSPKSAGAGQSGMDGMSTGAASAPSQSRSVVSTEASASVFTPALTSSVTFIPLGSIATVQIAQGPPMISSENTLLRSIVFLNVRDRDMGSFVSEAEKVLQAKLVIPTGYTVSWSGQFENQQHAKDRLMVLVPMVFIIIFVLLFFTLKDVKEAGVVMLSVPFALIGGVFLNAILGYNWSVAVWVGFIALYGVAVETGVVMVVYLHEALDRRLHAAADGKRGPITIRDIYDATVEGAVLRLRPKLMTVATAMLGLIPILWSSGAGADVMRPIAAPMIGGMVTSTVHVLVVTPVLFYLMKKRSLAKGTLKASALSGWMRHE
ncbi:MAG: CusA/CzcA family heavy metal efflux RND transporter [Candidatus Kapaibacterium sp.]|jgi:Cu(I)/Ag(I) efflux system membrane protein CusA/SilA